MFAACFLNDDIGWWVITKYSDMKNYYALNTRDSQSVQARRGGYTCSHGAWPNSKTGCHRLPPWIGSSNPSDDRDRFPRVTHTPRAAPAAPTVGTAASPRAALARRGIRPWPWAVGRGPGAGVLSSSRMNMTTDRERPCIYRYTKIQPCFQAVWVICYSIASLEPWTQVRHGHMLDQP